MTKIGMLVNTAPGFSNHIHCIFMSADIMSSLCGIGVHVHVNNSPKTTLKRSRNILFFFQKDTLSTEDEKVFKACRSVC